LGVLKKANRKDGGKSLRTIVTADKIPAKANRQTVAMQARAKAIATTKVLSQASSHMHER
jgi:hypothetical protein